MEMLSIAETLRDNRSATFTARGSSMEPLVHDGQKVTLLPLAGRVVEVDDIVLAKVKGRYYLHKVTAVRNGRAQIGNNRGHINGWASEILGVLA
jgi:hypothetical protein